MTAEQVQIRRDTAANLGAATPASGELGYNTTNNRLHGGNGVRAGGFPFPNFSDIQTQAFGYGTAGGSANARTLTLSPALLAYAAGVSVEFLSADNNTGATTININSLGTRNILKMKNGTLSALESGDIKSGGIYRITYDGTQFQIKALDEAAGNLAGWTLLSVATGGGSSYNFTSGITTTYHNYAFVLRNILHNGNVNRALQIRVRRSGQGSFDTGGSDYGHSGLSNDSKIVGISAAGSGNGGAGISGIVYAFGLAQSNYALFQLLLMKATTSGDAGVDHSAGLRKTTTAIDGVQFLVDSANIGSGSIYMYGMRSSLS